MLIEPYFDLYTKCDLILTYKFLTWFWPALSWPHFDLLSLTSFWPAIVWPHFDLWYLTSFTCNGVTWFWLAIVWPHFDLQWCDPILTCNIFTSFWPVMFDLIWPVVVWPDFDLQLFDLILTHNVWPYFDLQWCDLMLTYLVSWWPWPMQFKALVRPWHKWLHVWCHCGLCHKIGRRARNRMMLMVFCRPCHRTGRFYIHFSHKFEHVHIHLVYLEMSTLGIPRNEHVIHRICNAQIDI